MIRYKTSFLPYFVIDIANTFLRFHTLSRKMLYKKNLKDYVNYNSYLLNKVFKYKQGDKINTNGCINKSYMISNFMDDILYEPLLDLYNNKVVLVLYKNYKFMKKDIIVDEDFLKYKSIALNILSKSYKKHKIFTAKKYNRKIETSVYKANGINCTNLNSKYKQIYLIDERFPEKELNIYINLKRKNNVVYGERKYNKVRQSLTSNGKTK